ncbi:hypothetical protein GCM10009850_119630 [Nonomuraea monospora]|uniref:Uncharacterized protein n=1 Tax=Nonomuraea monospora TaxID=568818 RepID=A0ABN3D3U1_9ACTN
MGQLACAGFSPPACPAGPRDGHLRRKIRKGSFGDRHIGKRAQRPKLVAVIVALVVPTLALLTVLGAPRVMGVCSTIMLATLAAVGPINLRWKISSTSP